MLTIILQSAAAGLSFACGVVACLLAASIYSSRSRRELSEELKETNERIADRCLRSAVANERAALALARIAEQLEKNGK